MAKRRKKSNVNIPIVMACVLLWLTLISIHLTGGLYARYTTSASGSDSARVAQFGNLTITETGDFAGTTVREGFIIPGVDLIKNATVDFEGSEMATYVFVEVILSTNWETEDHKNFSVDGQLNWAIAEDWEYLMSDAYDENNRYVYFMTLKPNSSLEGTPIMADGGKINISEDITETEIRSFTNMTISLRASVIQSGGFQNEEDAWAALAAK